MRHKNITLTFDGHSARLTLNRPDQLNAMTPDMGREMEAAVAEINDTPEARVTVVRGAGRAFCAGGNLQALAQEAGLPGDGPGLGDPRRFYEAFLSVRKLKSPTVAAINGHAIGAGLCLALACDLRVMHNKAKVGMTFVKLGIHPGMAATWTLPRLVGPARAAEILYTGRIINAREALEIGLVNRISGDTFDHDVDSLVHEIAGSGPLAVRALKETLAQSATFTIEEAISREARAQADTFKSEDAGEGITAAMEKRTPDFKGR